MTSGIPSANAFIIDLDREQPVQSVNVGAGGTACMTQPGGASMRSGRKLPPFAGVSGRGQRLEDEAPMPIVQPMGMLIGPFGRGALIRSKSTIDLVVGHRDRAWILTSLSRSMPSSST